MNVKILKSCSFSLDGIKLISLQKGEIIDVVKSDDIRKLERHGVGTTDFDVRISENENQVDSLKDDQIDLVKKLKGSEKEEKKSTKDNKLAPKASKKGGKKK